MAEMALPPEYAGPVCDAFLQWAEKLLSAPEPGLCSISNLQYCVLTLKLLAEKNEHALLHVTSVLFEQQNRFMRAAFKFMLCDVPSQEGRLKVVEMLCDFIANIFRCSSAQKIVFANEVAVRGILASLQSLLAGDMLKKVQPPILNLMVTALYKFSSRWPSQPKDIQHAALHILKKLPQQIPAHPATQVLVKAIQIQLLTLVQQHLNDAVVVNIEEADFLLSALSSAFPILNADELVLLLKRLTMCEQNRLILMERGVLDSLAALVDDDDDGQESAAQLICALMDAVSICHEDQLEAKALENLDVDKPSTGLCVDTLLQVCDDGGFSDEVCSKAEKSQPDNGAMDLIKCLLPCTLTCFENFIAACTNKSHSVASLQVVYASTLLHLILEVFSHENEHTQTAIADSLATSAGVPNTFMTMLRTSTVVRCHIDSSPLPWIVTFISIQNCFIVWTNRSEQFCQALCSIGLVHFMEKELEKLTTVMSHADGSESRLGAPSHPVLAILYNCVQKQNCLPSFLRATDLHTSLEVFTMSSDLETRLLSKLILGFLQPTLTAQQQSLLQLKPDEVTYLLSTLNDASQSPDLSADGYSAFELLQGLLHFLEVEENLYICVESVLLKILQFFLTSSDQGLQKLVLHIVWNILTATNDAHTKETFLSLPDIVPVIKTLRVSSELELLHKCVLIRTQQPESLECGVLDLLAYARGCFQYQKYRECHLIADQILQQVSEKKLEQSIANEANLLKGKSLYFVYQKQQHMFLKTQSSQPIKEVEMLKNECYEKAKGAILHLGNAQDHGLLDTEGSRYLDYAMIDYLRETNNLGNCQRCLLCRRKAKLRRSHVYPKSILKKIARDLIEGQDHKVFTNIAVKVVTRSAGGMTYGMLCNECEQRLCQNGEVQFAKHIHSRICVNREVVQSQLKLKYGSWFYDFCIGIIFRGMAICDQFIRFGTDQVIYKVFTDCRKHLLSLPTKSPVQNSDNKPTTAAPVERASSPFLPPGSPLPISFFVNPTVDVPPDDSKLGYLTDVLITPAISFILEDLDTGEFLHDKPPSSILAHFDRMNILVQFQPSSTPSSLQCNIEPCGGELVVPEEYERWQVIPTGVWKIFFSLVEASENFHKVKRSHENPQAQSSTSSPKSGRDGTMSANFIYSFDSSFHQKNSAVVSLLPDCYGLVPDEDFDSCEVTIQFPQSHEVMMCTCREWGHEQRLACFVVEDGSRPYIVFALSLPGLHIVDGIFLDQYSCTVNLPFLDKKSKKNHPLKPSVIQALLKQNPEIEEYLHIRSQLS